MLYKSFKTHTHTSFPMKHQMADDAGAAGGPGPASMEDLAVAPGVTAGVRAGAEPELVE